MSALLSLCITPDQSTGPITPIPVLQTGPITPDQTTGPITPDQSTGPITPVPIPQTGSITPDQMTGPITPVPVPQTGPINPILTDETLSCMTNVLFSILIKEFSVHDSDVSVNGVSWCIKSLCLLAEATHLLLDQNVWREELPFAKCVIQLCFATPQQAGMYHYLYT
jgi:hypothetical protein